MTARFGKRAPVSGACPTTGLRLDEVMALGALAKTREIEERIARAEADGVSPRFRAALARAAYEELVAHDHDEEARAFAPAYLTIARPAAADANFRIRRLLGRALLANGRYAEAESTLAQVVREHPNYVHAVGDLAVAAARAGHPTAAESLARVPAEWPRPYDRPVALSSLTRLAALAGDRARAVALLEQAVAAGQRWRAGGVYSDFHVTPEFRALHGYGPYGALMRLRE